MFLPGESVTVTDMETFEKWVGVLTGSQKTDDNTAITQYEVWRDGESEWIEFGWFQHIDSRL